MNGEIQSLINQLSLNDDEETDKIIERANEIFEGQEVQKLLSDESPIEWRWLPFVRKPPLRNKDMRITKV